MPLEMALRRVIPVSPTSERIRVSLPSYLVARADFQPTVGTDRHLVSDTTLVISYTRFQIISKYSALSLAAQPLRQRFKVRSIHPHQHFLAMDSMHRQDMIAVKIDPVTRS